jgi:hypothetical protein
MANSETKPQPSNTPSQKSSQNSSESTDVRGKGRFRPLLVVIFTGILFIAVLFFVLLPISAYGYFQLYGVIVPGVRVGELELGGLTWQEAKDGLDLVYGFDKELTLSDGDRNWTASASEFGLSWDTTAMAQQALNVGHGKDFLSEVEEILTSLRYGWEIDPILDVDPAKVQRGLIAWERNVLIAPVNAFLSLVGDQVIVQPSQSGLGLDVETTLNLIIQDPEAVLESSNIVLLTEVLYPDIPNVDDSAEELERVLGRVINISAFDPILNDVYEWTIDRGTIASWLSIVDGGAGPEVHINPDEIFRSSEEINTSLDDDQFVETDFLAENMREMLDKDIEVNLQVFHHPTRYLVREGDTLLKLGWRMRMPYWMIMEANPELYDLGLQTGQDLTIPSLDDLIPLPMVPDKRIVMSISEQRLRTYEGGELLDEHVISTGIDRSPTQPGVFQVQTHELNAYASVWDLYMPHFLGIYEAWPGFMNGLHGLPTLSNGERLWADVLGRPASFGCIILELAAAEALYEWAEEGVVVEILE